MAAVRAAVPGSRRRLSSVATRNAARQFAKRVGGAPAETHREAGEQDVVVTVTTSKDPVLRGEWLRPGALVCAVGANIAIAPRARQHRARARGLRVLRLEGGRAARVGRPDRAGRRRACSTGSRCTSWPRSWRVSCPGRQSDDDIVVFKSNGIAAWDVAIAAALVVRAKEEGAGRRALASGIAACAQAGRPKPLGPSPHVSARLPPCSRVEPPSPVVSLASRCGSRREPLRGS